MKHKSIINLRAIIDDSLDDKVYMVMEYANNGQIMTYSEDTLKFTPSRSGPVMLSESEIRNYCI